MRHLLCVVLILGCLSALADPAGGQALDVPPPYPMLALAPALLEWTPRLTAHAGLGTLTHQLDPQRRHAPAFLVSAGYKVDEWARSKWS